MAAVALVAAPCVNAWATDGYFSHGYGMKAKGMGGADVVVSQVPSFNYVYLALSPGAKGAEKMIAKVREAIRLALDYKGLIDATVGGAGQVQA